MLLFYTRSPGPHQRNSDMPCRVVAFTVQVAESVESEMGAPQDSNRLDTTLEKPENTDKLSLTEDANFVELDGTAEEVNVTPGRRRCVGAKVR